MNNKLISVPFHSDKLIAIIHSDKPYVAVKPLCESIGLTWGSQYNRIVRDEVLSTCIFITKIQIPGDDQQREMIFLPAEMLQGWLFGVSVNHAKPELREKLIMYKRECFSALHDYFTKGEAKRKAPAKEEPEYRYRVKVIIYDDIMGTSLEFWGKENEMRAVAAGISTDLGFKPNAFTHVPMNRKKFKQIH